MKIEAKADAEELLNEMLPFGGQMLASYGEFVPYGGAMTPDGEIVSVSGLADEDDSQSSQAILDVLKTGLRASARKGEYKATAVFFDVRVTPPGASDPSDAIAVALDHVDDYSVLVVMPYTLTDSRVEFGETFAQAGAGDIFVH